MIERSQLVALMGIPDAELASLEETDEGHALAVTADGARYLHVPADRPDAEGKTGLMYAETPTEAYGDAFPVYTRPDDEAAADDEGSEPAKKTRRNGAKADQ